MLKQIFISTMFLVLLSLVVQAQELAFVRNETESMLEYYTLNSTEEAWEQNKLFVYLSVDAESTNSQYLSSTINKMEDFIGKLEKKQSRMSEDRFLRWMFYKTHEEFLHHYENAVTFGQMVNTGKYDCLTGTMLYAYFLEELGFSYTIHEMSAHVYLKVHKSNGRTVLFEATDPQKGYVWERDKIQKRELKYLKDSDYSKYYFRYSNWKESQINMKALAGLQYFNQAVVALHQKDIEQALVLLKKTEVYYQSHRIDEIRDLISKYQQKSYYVTR